MTDCVQTVAEVFEVGEPKAQQLQQLAPANDTQLARVSAPSKDVALVNSSEQALVSAKEKSTQEKVITK